eukprot:1372076-Amorphochlora_amoeboformis.AAC.1
MDSNIIGREGLKPRKTVYFWLDYGPGQGNIDVIFRHVIRQNRPNTTPMFLSNYNAVRTQGFVPQGAWVVNH